MADADGEGDEAGAGGRIVDLRSPPATGPDEPARERRRSRRRRAGVAAAVAGLLLAVVVGVGALFTAGYAAYPTGACKGIGYVPALLDEPDRWVAPTPEAALGRIAADPMSGRALPPTGWVQHRGQWVLDLDDGTFVTTDVHRTDGGWVAGGDFWTCRRAGWWSLPW